MTSFTKLLWLKRKRPSVNIGWKYAMKLNAATTPVGLVAEGMPRVTGDFCQLWPHSESGESLIRHPQFEIRN